MHEGWGIFKYWWGKIKNTSQNWRRTSKFVRWDHIAASKGEKRQDSRRSLEDTWRSWTHLEDVHAKYDGIISKARLIKDQDKRIEYYIVYENKIDEMGVQNEEKPSNVKPYRHPHYHERKED